MVVEEFCLHFGWWVLLKFLGKVLCLLRPFKTKVELLGLGVISLEHQFLLFLGKLPQHWCLVNLYRVALWEGILSL